MRGVDALETVRRAWSEGQPWSVWRPPGGTLRVGAPLVTIDFPRVEPPRAREVAYSDCVSEALAAIDAGEVEKVVIARREVAGPADPTATLTVLLERFPTCWVFAVSSGDEVFLGATPELLVRVDGSNVETVALAGTSLPGEDALLRSEKDLREHNLVVDAVRAALLPHCTDIDIAKSPELLVLPNVQHLRTPVRATLRPDVDPMALVDALHPTPAVCGTPRDAARAVIDRIEPFVRGRYAGVIGLVEDARVEFVVALRSAVVTRTHTYLYAGAGIVRGSDPADEDRETLRKLDAVRGALRVV